MLRRHRVRSLVSGIPGKLVSRLASPGMLLAAAGAGVAVEQASHDRRWANSVIYQAASILIGLLFARPSQVSQAIKAQDGWQGD
jgi:hypothetical protein